MKFRLVRTLLEQVFLRGGGGGGLRLEGAGPGGAGAK